MLILATISGIQDYLFDVQESGGGQARSLRHRSFRIQLYAECVALRLLDELQLPHERLLFCAAAKLGIDASGRRDTAGPGLAATISDLERQLLQETHGRLRLTVVISNAGNGFRQQFEGAHQQLRRAKLSPSFGCVDQSEHVWSQHPLVIPEIWVQKTEASRDAEIGRRLANARSLSICRRSAGQASHLALLGLQIELSDREPRPSADLLSCSNLSEPETRPQTIDSRLFHPRRLARHIPRDEQGDAIEFVDLASRGVTGAPMLGVLKIDVDDLGAAIASTLQARDDPRALRSLSQSLDHFFAESLEQAKRAPGSPWSDIYTVFSGGDDLLAVGPWQLILDFAAFVQSEFTRQFATDPKAPHGSLTLSAGIALIKPRYPVHFAAAQADDLLDRAKTTCAPRSSRPKDQCAALGAVWKWRDHRQIIDAARLLVDLVHKGAIERGWLQSLLDLTLLRGCESGSNAQACPAMATSRLAYQIARNWPGTSVRDPFEAVAGRWISKIFDQFDNLDSTTHLEALFLPAVLRYALLATRSGLVEVSDES